MRIVPYGTVVDAVCDLCKKASSHLGADVLAAMQSAALHEESPRGRAIMEQCLENAAIASKNSDPICQDTGTAVFFVTLGSGISISGGTLVDAINDGVRKGYREGYLRFSIVSDPVFDRKNTRDNTPAVVHYEIVAGDTLSIVHLPKGGGSENVSALGMLNPADGPEGIVNFVVESVVSAGGNPCPPLIAGVGIGGSSDTVMTLAKKALLRSIGSVHADERYAALEKSICEKINRSGVGPQGLGGTVTALVVHIEIAPCHIASMPVGVTVNCHAARRAEIIL